MKPCILPHDRYDVASFLGSHRFLKAAKLNCQLNPDPVKDANEAACGVASKDQALILLSVEVFALSLLHSSMQVNIARYH